MTRTTDVRFTSSLLTHYILQLRLGYRLRECELLEPIVGRLLVGKCEGDQFELAERSPHEGDAERHVRPHRAGRLSRRQRCVRRLEAQRHCGALI